MSHCMHAALCTQTIAFALSLRLALIQGPPEQANLRNTPSCHTFCAFVSRDNLRDSPIHPSTHFSQSIRHCSSPA
ncbi:hypothetical protein BDN70DRAFT_23431 [Pholiota conissans]|uniref:Secreted protein n=1 Tax=Pholiota conissans TaxID=109636 RepID=A0A9P5ZE50_9AGAR|nr:hypothetical protein BDN70DRAFT_23431 [Pholiota conissans]